MRKCKNWLASFREWTVPRTESTEIVMFWCGMYCLSSVLKHNVKIPKEILGNWEAIPNLYIILVGPQGVIKKSTTIDYSQTLLNQVPDINFSKSVQTQADLFKAISETKDGSISVISSEFSSLVMKSGIDMYDFLVDAYDGKKLTSGIISRAQAAVARPCLNLLGATTPIWIKERMPLNIVSGGFSSRTLWIYETESRDRFLFPTRNKDFSQYTKLEQDLIEDLVYISTTLRGNVDIESDETADFAENWYKKLELPNSPYMQGFFARKGTHFLKTALILSVAESDELIIRRHHFEAAIKIVEQVEGRLGGIFKAIGKNPYTLDMDSILGYITDKKKVARKEVIANFYHSAQPEILNNLITGLIQAGMIDAEMVNNEIWLSAK